MFKNLFILFFQLLISISAFAKYDVSVCAIFQDEAPYLKEWIEFHKLQGVQHFYLYNNNSRDDFRPVLQPYIDKRMVTLTEWPYTYEEGAHADWIAIQSSAYMDCIKRHGAENRWLAVIDPDEFLFCPNGKQLPRFLRGYTQFGGIRVNWVKFGTSHIEEIPAGSLQIESLTQCSHYEDGENKLAKSIVQPRYVRDCDSAHYFLFIPSKFSVDSNKSKVPPKNFSKRILLDKIRINHYWTRTEQYLREKKIPSRQKRRSEFTAERQMALAEKYNQRQDIEILQFVKELKKAMQKTERRK